MVGQADIGSLTDLHNQVATAYVETGLIGGSALSVLLLYPYRVLVMPRRINLAAGDSTTNRLSVVVAQSCTVASMFCASNSMSIWPWWVMIGLMIRTTMPPPPIPSLRTAG
jgi:hypothetical protein